MRPRAGSLRPIVLWHVHERFCTRISDSLASRYIIVWGWDFALTGAERDFEKTRVIKVEGFARLLDSIHSLMRSYIAIDCGLWQADQWGGSGIDVVSKVAGEVDVLSILGF